MVVTWEANSIFYVQFKIISPFILKNVLDKSRLYQLFLQSIAKGSNEEERNKFRNENARFKSKITSLGP